MSHQQKWPRGGGNAKAATGFFGGFEEFTFLEGSMDNLSVEGGELVAAGAVDGFLMHPTVISGAAPLRASVGVTGPLNTLVAIMVKIKDVDNYLLAQQAVLDGGPFLDLYKKDGGTFTALDFTSIYGTKTMRAAQRTWMSLDVADNVIVASQYHADPDLGAPPNWVGEHVLSPGDAAKFGAGVSGKVGIRAQNNAAGTSGSTTGRWFDFLCMSKG